MNNKFPKLALAGVAILLNSVNSSQLERIKAILSNEIEQGQIEILQGDTQKLPAGFERVISHESDDQQEGQSHPTTNF